MKGFGVVKNLRLIFGGLLLGLAFDVMPDSPQKTALALTLASFSKKEAESPEGDGVDHFTGVLRQLAPGEKSGLDLCAVLKTQEFMLSPLLAEMEANGLIVSRERDLKIGGLGFTEEMFAITDAGRKALAWAEKVQRV